ncbi:MAG: DNA primase [bacterium]|nr:DNA primase [bacterium]
MRYDDSIKQEIRERIDIVELISEYLSLKRSGTRFLALCPFHDEKTPSFSINQDLKIFKCFGCGKGGDVFTFLMSMENLSFPETIRRLAERANVPLELDQQAVGDRDLLYRVNKMASVYYHQILMDKTGGAPARNYLTKRGLNKKVWESFKLGYAPAGWDHLLKLARAKKVPEQILQSSGLVVRNKNTGNIYDRFRERLMFPIRDTGGRVVAFGGRILGEGEPKYLNSSETDIFRKSSTLYGYDKARMVIRETGRAAVVEGYTDVIACHEQGISYAVASMGTALSATQVKQLQNLAEEVVLVFDGDSAGRAAAERAQDLVGRGTLQGVKVLVLPDGEDPDSFLKKHGKAALEEFFNTSVPLLEYLLDRKIAGRDISTPEGKSQVIRVIAPILSREGDPVIREEYVKQLADRFQMKDPTLFPEKAFRASLQRHLERGGVAAGNEDLVTSLTRSDSLYVKAEKFVLNIVLNHPELMEKAFPALDLEHFSEPECKKLVSHILGKVKKKQPFEWKTLLDSRDQSVVDQLTYLLLLKKVILAPEKVLENSMSVLLLRRLKINRRQLVKKIEQLGEIDEKLEQGLEGKELEQYLELRKQLSEFDKKTRKIEEDIDYDYLNK